MRVSRGYAFLTVAGTQAPRLPKLDEVKDRVKEDVTKQKAKELALQKATAAAATLKGAADWTKAAKAAGVEVKTTELVARESPLPDIGVSAAVDAVAFALPAGAVSDPIVTDNAVAVVKVVERKEPTPAEIRRRARPAARGDAERPPRPLLHRLHAEGEAEDEDRGQPRERAEGHWVEGLEARARELRLRP